MSCLSLSITTSPPASLSVQKTAPASLRITGSERAQLQLFPQGKASLSISSLAPASIALTPTEPLALIVAEVCSVCSGTLVVLAASDGPLRTKDGGYFLLNPETNPPDS